jgi:hypothetical protein
VPRIRQIKPVFFIDDDLACCSRDARFFFVGLWVLADRAGRLEDRPARMKAQIFPYDADITIQEVEGFLGELSNGQFITRYIVNGKRLIQIRTFDKHQHCHHREPDSQLPPPEELPTEHCISLGQARGEPEAKPGQEPDEPRSSPTASGEWVSASGYIYNGILRVGERLLGNGSKSGVNPLTVSEKSAPARPAGDFVLTQELRETAQKFAPTIDLDAEAEKFRNFYGRNGKIFADLPKAWFNWIARAVEFEQRARSPGPSYRESIAERNARVFAEVQAEDAAKAKQAEQGGRGS